MFDRFDHSFRIRFRRQIAAYHHHLILVTLAIILFVVAVTVGSYQAGRHDALQYFQHRYGHTVQVFKVPHPRNLVSLPASITYPAAASLVLAKVPAVGDQYSLGSCAAWTAAEAATYYWRAILHPGSWLRFSSRFMYSSSTRGNDNGSYVGENLAWFTTTGVPRFKQLPYPPYIDDATLPVNDAFGHNLAADAAVFRMPEVTITSAPGQAAINFIHAEISTGHPVMIAFAVYQSYFRSKGFVGVPGPNESVQGGHENLGMAYDDNIRCPDGSLGALRIRNQWSVKWSDRGDAWMCFSFINAVDATGRPLYLYEMAGLRLGSQLGSGPQAHFFARASLRQPVRFVPSAGKTFGPPPLPKNVKPKAGRGGYWMRSGPYHSIVNAAGRAYGIWPLGIAATIGTESAFNTYAYRNTSPQDYSCGLLQVTIPTARGEGVGGSDQQVCQWLYSPTNSIWLGARMLAKFRSIACERFAPYSGLYASWNMGPYLGCGNSQYLYPSNPITQQAVRNWISWIHYGQASWR